MPGVRMRFLPEANALLIVAALSVGCAMKNFSIRTDDPGVAPAAHDAPTELSCTAGTKTLYFPSESTYRYGSSRVTGLVASVVYGPLHGDTLGKHWAGAPTTPENTWFHTPLVHPSILLFLVIHCCCVALIMVPRVNCESAMNPPLANPGPLQ